jgi:hypothetical protein
MSYEQILVVVTLMLFGIAVKKSGRSADGQTPKGWLKSGSHPQNYEMSIDPAIKHQGKPCARIRFTGKRAAGFGTLMQIFKADDFQGKCLQMSVWMKSREVKAAQLWMRLDGANGEMLGFDNMDDRPVKGTTDWKKYEITLNVPKNAAHIAFGAVVGGRGEAWVSDFRFEVVASVPPKRINDEKEYPRRPANLDFEE